MPKAENATSDTKYRYRFGIGEWYGKSFVNMELTARDHFATVQTMSKNKKPFIPCPFRTTATEVVKCSKVGGVCSIRAYREDAETGKVAIADGTVGELTATCPHRFKQKQTVYQWVGEDILKDGNPAVLGEVGFLESVVEGSNETDEDGNDVGMIDNVLMSTDDGPLRWCALEIQGVYFSGRKMGVEFDNLISNPDPLPFPAGDRHPDYRSSGPKRLMPQLQIKVPSLRRWGKKMAVVVDENFFRSLGKMDDVKDLSNADIAWYVVRFVEKGGDAVLENAFVRYTTLERAVEGLTGGIPVRLDVFESRLNEKLLDVTKRMDKLLKKAGAKSPSFQEPN